MNVAHRPDSRSGWWATSVCPSHFEGEVAHTILAGAPRFRYPQPGPGRAILTLYFMRIAGLHNFCYSVTVDTEQALVDQWFDHLEHDRGRARNTVLTYRRTIRTFDSFRDPEQDPAGPPLPRLHVDLATATRHDIETWWRSRAKNDEGKTRPHSSRNNELAAVRSFYRWANRFDLLTEDPTKRIDVLKAQRRVSKFIGNEDLHHLLTHLPPDMKRAVALGAYAGLRVSEAAGLHWKDVDVSRRRITVVGKGDQERTIGVGVLLLDLLLPDRGGNVITGREEGYDGHYLTMKVNEAMKRNGVTLTYHKLRHRFGYMSAASGVPLSSISRAMGHSNLQTTLGYIAPNDSDLDLIAEAVTR